MRCSGSCTPASGPRVSSSLDVRSCRGGDVQNVNGQLECAGYNGYNGGVYQPTRPYNGGGYAGNMPAGDRGLAADPDRREQLRANVHVLDVK